MLSYTIDMNTTPRILLEVSKSGINNSLVIGSMLGQTQQSLLWRDVTEKSDNSEWGPENEITKGN